MLLCWLVLFKLGFSISGIRRVREINLVPFRYDNVIEGDLFWLEPIFNMVAFLPFGILLRKLDCNIKFGFCIFLIVSLFFETVQFIFSIGVSDITDIITNIMGGVIGMLIVDILDKNK
ncbi:MAG: VanZ family protein [Peptoniphilaceae bacterium]|nr:VanZ family protein [Peptoniphilaceae bacterium]